jgi:hypothetical protein
MHRKMTFHKIPWLQAAALALESNRVIALRLVKLSAGGSPARAEASRMIREKVDAVLEASATLMTGGSSAKVIAQYRKRVAANHKRLNSTRRK